jgi:glycine oxidase
VYGDILRLRVPESLQPLVTSTIRGMVRGVPVYIVPRDDGTVVIGATQREDGLSSGSNAVSAGGVYQLLRDAQVLVPAVAELELLEATARARPGTPDNAPLLGRVAGPEGDVEGLVVATGFFRHGVLLTPVAAHIACSLISGRTDPRWARFRPDRFPGAASGQRTNTLTNASSKETA